MEMLIVLQYNSAGGYTYCIDSERNSILKGGSSSCLVFLMDASKKQMGRNSISIDVEDISDIEDNVGTSDYMKRIVFTLYFEAAR
jgi:hypothetical protein